MIVKNKFGELTVVCDRCSDFLDTTEIEFSEAWKEAKGCGWTRKFDPATEQWLNYCPDCSGD